MLRVFSGTQEAEDKVEANLEVLFNFVHEHTKHPRLNQDFIVSRYHKCQSLYTYFHLQTP